MIAHTKPEGGIEVEGTEGEENHALLAAAEDLIRAVHSKDAKAVAAAMEACHEICMCNGGIVGE